MELKIRRHPNPVPKAKVYSTFWFARFLLSRTPKMSSAFYSVL